MCRSERQLGVRTHCDGDANWRRPSTPLQWTVHCTITHNNNYIVIISDANYSRTICSIMHNVWSVHSSNTGFCSVQNLCCNDRNLLCLTTLGCTGDAFWIWPTLPQFICFPGDSYQLRDQLWGIYSDRMHCATIFWPTPLHCDPDIDWLAHQCRSTPYPLRWQWSPWWGHFLEYLWIRDALR